MSIATFKALGNHGRLANAIFQAVATISFSLDTNRDFIFPDWKYRHYFKKELPIGDVDSIPIHHTFAPPFHYTPFPNYPREQNINLFSHFQSDKYFSHNWDKIKPYFELKDEYIERAKLHYLAHHSMLPSMGRTCAIHIRLGDYDTEVNRAFHGVMPREYYEKALQTLYTREGMQYVQCIVFSDEPEKAEALLSGIAPNMEYSTGVSDIIDLYAMALCDDFIISNSSYAWWGAYLSPTPDKRVVCPKNWFNCAPGHDSKDVACEGWIVI